VNAETFAKWKEARLARRAAQAAVAEAEAKKNAAKGSYGLMSGRALFTYDPSLFIDDADAGINDDYSNNVENAEENVDENTKTGEDDEVVAETADELSHMMEGDEGDENVDDDAEEEEDAEDEDETNDVEEENSHEQEE
jgi:DRG Family Regulatory Proteins, Tma46